MSNHRSSSKRIVIPVTAQDRQRLIEIKEKLGSWTAVSESLGFRGASTARKWALSDSTTFKGKDYPERIKQLHERVVGKPITAKAPGAVVEKRLEHVETMMETLLNMFAQHPQVAEAVKSRRGREGAAKETTAGEGAG